MNLAPVAIFACRRPRHLRDLLTSLLSNPEASRTDLYFFIGGPKDPADWPLVRETIEVAKSASGFRTSILFERYEKNTGSALIRDGISSILDISESVICLEDDLIVRPDFLNYMNLGLRKFANAYEVAAISGWNYGIINPDSAMATYLFPCTTSWGWATWRRSWVNSFDTQSNFDWLTHKSSRIHKFNFFETYNCLRMVERVLEEEYDAWDAEWYLHCFKNSLLTLYPNSSLVINRGFDGSGLNFRRSYPWKSDFEESPQISFHFPEIVKESNEYSNYVAYLKVWAKTFWPESSFKIFVDKLKRKRQQHIKYSHPRFYF